MMTCQSRGKAAWNSLAVCTCANSGAYPPRRSSRTSRATSSVESSTNRTRSGVIRCRPNQPVAGSPEYRSGRNLSFISRGRQAVTARRRSLVQEQPIQSELADSRHKAVEIDRLADVAVRAVSVRPYHVRLLLGRGQDDDAHQLRPRVGPQPPEHFQAVQAG